MAVPLIPIEAEIARINELTRTMLREYVAWGDKFSYGEVQNVVYGEVLDFANFRMESAASCLELIGKDQIGDVLGLCRSILENYLLLILICRGRKYFEVLDLSGKSPEEFKRILNEQQAMWEKQRGEGKTNCVGVRRYPRSARHIMYLYDDLKLADGESLPVSMHYFQFAEFNPETMRLDTTKYFEFYEPDKELKDALKEHRKRAEFQYRHYLSYEGLLECLKLNQIVDDKIRTRIEAHYTFLGKYLHPTRDAMRELHEKSNYYEGRPSIGMTARYLGSARLLASMYVCHLVAGVLTELVNLFEAAPAKWMKEAGTAELRRVTEDAAEGAAYFWFLFNEAPAYDRFDWAVHHLSDEKLTEYGGYLNVPSDIILFNQHIHSHFSESLQGWSNQRVGVYAPPI